jgi:hypothetical protein
MHLTRVKDDFKDAHVLAEKITFAFADAASLVWLETLDCKPVLQITRHCWRNIIEETFYEDNPEKAIKRLETWLLNKKLKTKVEYNLIET